MIAITNNSNDNRNKNYNHKEINKNRHCKKKSKGRDTNQTPYLGNVYWLTYLTKQKYYS